jgi:biotin transport system substrate-specific component
MVTLVGGVVGFACLVALGARVAVPIPFSPVPLTLQVPFVLLAGALLGARGGAVSMATYLAAGASGLPAFALGAGPQYLFGPTGGYLMGFVPAAALVGWLAPRLGGRFAGLVASMAAGLLVIHALGAAQLATFVGGWRAAWVQGIAPFLIADLIKVFGAAAAASLCLSRRRPSPEA